jgi:hypothetical protein
VIISPRNLADKAILFLKNLRAVAPKKPFFLWFTPGAISTVIPGGAFGAAS